MKHTMSSRDALVMGVAIITASLVLVMSLASSPMVGLALQNTETATVEVTATTDMSGAMTATPMMDSGTMMTPCVDAVPANTDATAMAATEATSDMNATVDTSATPSMDTTATSNPTSFLGVVVAAVGDCGVRVVEVFADSPAFLAQLAVGDVIVAVNGVPVTELTTMQNTRPDGMMNYASVTTAGFFMAIHALPPGTQVVLTVQRDGEQLDLTATLVALAPDAVANDLEGTPSAVGTSVGTPSASGTPDMNATIPITETLEATATP